jgi:hypothetical protein
VALRERAAIDGAALAEPWRSASVQLSTEPRWRSRGCE